MQLLHLVLPRSLVGRVFGLYTLAMLSFVGAGLALFYRFQFTVQLEQTEDHAQTITTLVAPAVADAAVIGDYDTIERTLERSLHNSAFASAAFIDVKGGKVSAENDEPIESEPPQWLTSLYAERLYDSNLPINVGGRDYGVLRLTFAPARVAGSLWTQTRYALWLAFGGLAFGLLLIRWPLGNWLGNLDRIRSLQDGLRAGTAGQQAALTADAPIELRQTFDVLNQAAASLQAQREQAAVTLGAIADGVITLDSGGRIVIANPAACEMLQSDASSLLGRPVHLALPEVFPTDSAPQPWASRRYELRRGGFERVLDSALTVVRDADGEQVAGYVLACRDMSAQHALDQQLRAEIRSREAALLSMRSVLEGLLPHASDRADPGADADGTLEALSRLIGELVTQVRARGDQLSAIFALSPDGFVSFDQERRISLVSPAFSALTGLDEARLRGLGEADLMSLLQQQAQSGGTPPDCARLRQRQSDGSQARLVLELARPALRVLELGLQEGGSSTVSQVLHVRDITHETEVDRMKSEFLSTAAHELRTPMTSIHGFIELMLMRDMSVERRKDVLKTVRRQTQLMMSILNELLDLARIEARQGSDFSFVELDLVELSREFAHDCIAPAGRAPLQLAIEVPGPALVQADRLKLLQAIGNVVSNAYKYSSSGVVQLQLVAHTDETRGPALGLRVSDQGMGMTPEQLARVTERFYRADASGNVPGTGLGMSIVKEVMSLQHGWMDLQSQRGIGTTVTLWLPATQARDTAAA